MVGDQVSGGLGPKDVVVDVRSAEICCSSRPRDPYEDLFLGVPGDESGIASKLPSVTPPSGFKWQFITGLWLLIPIVMLVIPLSSAPVPPDTAVPLPQLATSRGSDGDLIREHSLGDSASGEGASLKQTMRQIYPNPNLRRLSYLFCLVFV